MISDTMKSNWSEYRRNLTRKLPKNVFSKSYRWILIFFEILLIIFGKFGHLKDGSQSYLVQSDPQESVNLQSIKNRIHSMTFSRYAQGFGNITSWRVGDINFQVFLKSCPLDFTGRFTAPSHISSCKLFQ